MDWLHLLAPAKMPFLCLACWTAHEASQIEGQLNIKCIPPERPPKRPTARRGGYWGRTAPGPPAPGGSCLWERKGCWTQLGRWESACEQGGARTSDGKKYRWIYWEKQEHHRSTSYLLPRVYLVQRFLDITMLPWQHPSSICAFLCSVLHKVWQGPAATPPQTHPGPGRAGGPATDIRNTKKCCKKHNVASTAQADAQVRAYTHTHTEAYLCVMASRLRHSRARGRCSSNSGSSGTSVCKAGGGWAATAHLRGGLRSARHVAHRAEGAKCLALHDGLPERAAISMSLMLPLERPVEVGGLCKRCTAGASGDGKCQVG
eukprot:519461-Pelagomonas_calceolata.AAC.6